MRIRCWILPLAFIGALPQISAAQSSDWAVVEHLPPGQKIKIETTDGKSKVGTVQSVADDAIWIGKDQSIQKQDVHRISLKTGGHHGRNALIGLGVGAGVGIGLGASCSGKNSFFSVGECMAVTVPLFGGVGAGIGALLPSHGGWHELYRSR